MKFIAISIIIGLVACDSFHQENENNDIELRRLNGDVFKKTTFVYSSYREKKYWKKCLDEKSVKRYDSIMTDADSVASQKLSYIDSIKFRYGYGIRYPKEDSIYCNFLKNETNELFYLIIDPVSKIICFLDNNLDTIRVAISSQYSPITYDTIIPGGDLRIYTNSWYISKGEYERLFVYRNFDSITFKTHMQKITLYNRIN